jgi:lactaldehyde dehydrogenase/glycolaldehyde dehydrogenase
MPFDDVEEAFSLANDTKYGLSAYLFTNDFKRIMRAVDAVRFGEVYVNKIGPEQLQGFHTGYGLSGQGGDDGVHGLAHYSRKKTVYLNYGDEPAANLMPYPAG